MSKILSILVHLSFNHCRRSISKFYCGKSRSFALLSDSMAKLSSVKELGKPENGSSKKRKKLLNGGWQTAEFDLSGGTKRHANLIEGAPWASPLVETEMNNSFNFGTLSLIDLEGIESFISSLSTLPSMGHED